MEPSEGKALPNVGSTNQTQQPAATRDLIWWLLIGCCGLAFIGAVGPWATLANFADIYGTSREGWLVIAAAGIALAILLVSETKPTKIRVNALFVVALAGLAIAGISAYDWAHISEIDSKIPGAGLIAGFLGKQELFKSSWGIWLVTASGVLLAVLAVARIVLLTRANQASSLTQGKL